MVLAMERSLLRLALVCVFAVVLTTCSKRDDDNDEVSLRDTVRTLKGQVSALLERRQEDYRILEDSLRRSLEKNFELSTLRSDLDDLRREMEEMRCTKVGNRQKNDHLTVQWLSTAVNELRHEVTEVAAAHNASVELQRRQETDTELGLLRSDVAGLRRDFEEVETGQERNGARLSQIQQEMGNTRSQSQGTAALCADLKAQLQASQLEWTTTLKSLKRTTPLQKKHLSLSLANDIPRLPSLSEDKRYRHNRDLRVKMAELANSEKRLKSSHSHLEHRVRRLEKQLEKTGNESRQTAGVDKIHQSMLELLESVEGLENKVDKTVPDLQREISKMEFNMAQVTSSLALFKENQENMGLTMKAVSSGVSALQEKVSVNREEIEILQDQVGNATSSEDSLLDQATPVKSSETGAGGRDSQKTRSNVVQHLVQELNQVQQDYQGIIERLPHECSAVSGGSGLYLIAPGGIGSPLMAHCDQDTGAGGWTTIQRRVDGSQDFNLKWDEYAKGFGSPAGEFWLGNDGLHRLTGDNCSSLRVDLTDIYGKRWVAEYLEFSVGPADDGYRLHVAGYHGNASDALAYQNRMQFSAIDSDRDISNTHCASNYEGGWWFSHCQHANLNGRYTLGLTWFDGVRNEWIAVATSDMKVRRRDACHVTPPTPKKT